MEEQQAKQKNEENMRKANQAIAQNIKSEQFRTKHGLRNGAGHIQRDKKLPGQGEI